MTRDHDGVVCCDLDGVVWRASRSPARRDGIARLRAAGWRVVFMTNNSSLRVADYVERLATSGITAEPDDVCTSAQAAAALVAIGARRRAARCWRARGRAWSRRSRSTGCGWSRRPARRGGRRLPPRLRLRRVDAAPPTRSRGRAVRRDQPRPDLSDRRRYHPGAGGLAAAVATAAGRTPEVAGKPESPMVDLVRTRYGTAGVVGDRPSTDGAFAAALGWPFALVLSGVAGSAGGEPVPDPPPPFVAADLAHSRAGDPGVGP